MPENYSQARLEPGVWSLSCCAPFTQSFPASLLVFAPLVIFLVKEIRGAQEEERYDYARDEDIQSQSYHGFSTGPFSSAGVQDHTPLVGPRSGASSCML